VKTCNCCGRTHSWLGWRLLPKLGTVQIEAHDPILEMRNCPCGSTLGLEYYPEERWTVSEVLTIVAILAVSLGLALWVSL
jgi:hypothetical protein